eukprot:5994115-Ditylum_brightwellii.AAC.1
MDSFRLFGLNGGLLNNDAVACYDCMIPAISSLHLQSLGESANFYQHSEVHMKGGEGQGKTLSPPNLSFQSSTLLNSLEEQCEGLYLTITADQWRQAEDTPETIQERMCCVAQTWADLIHGSGSEVSMEMSCWGLVWWMWNKGKARLATVAEVDAAIKLTNGNSTEMV